MAAEPLLLLFDIDGTLVSGAAEAHAQALHEALQAVHGVDARRVPIPIPPAGRTDPETAWALLLRAGAQADELRCLAVATGPYPADALGDADAVVGDAGELRGVLKEML